MDHNKVSQFASVLADVVKKCVNESIKHCQFDESYRGMVTDDLGNGLYKVRINHAEYTAKCTSRKLCKGTPEWVTVPRGNWNELFIR